MEIIKDFNDMDVRIFMKNEEPFFASMDVCSILEIKNPSQAISYLDKDDLISNEVIDSIGRKQKISFVNESGLYQLIFRSRKESAKKFKKWVTHEVLPSIRKTGKYSIPEKLKKNSTDNRKLITREWQRHGIEKPNEFIKLTLEEYRFLNIEKGKRKKDFNHHEMLLINALESMESLKLFSSDVDGYEECAISLINTAGKVNEISGNKRVVN